jgi:tetratricopeptide (TPR) repeat protein
MKISSHAGALLVGVLILVFAIPAVCENSGVWIERGNALWQERRDIYKVEEALNAYKKGADIDPESYEAQWKIARAFFLLGDMLDEIKENRKQHKKFGKEGMRYGQRAFELNNQGVEGHYYYGLCLAKYTLGISFITALTQGIASKYEEHMEKAAEIDRDYDSAGPLRALGRYWHRIPWPKRDMEKSISYLEEAVRRAPMNLRGRFYLAEAYLKVKKRKLAKEQLQIAVELPIDPYEEISSPRWKEKSELLLERNF